LRALVLIAGTILTPGCGRDDRPPLLAATTPPTVRVQLGRTRTRAQLEISGQSWEVTSVAGRAYGVRGATTLDTALEAGAGGIRLRGQDTGADALRIRPSSTFRLDGRRYRGTLIVRRRATKLELVNELDLETYVAGVIGNEVGPNAEPATYRAQAVTARTYAYIRLQRPGARERAYHLFDDSRSQVYTGIDPPRVYRISFPDMVRFTRDTRGVVLTWQGRPFAAYYASTCGGHTTDAATSALDPGHAVDLLRGVPCAHCTTSRYFEWSKTVKPADLIAGLKRAGRPISAPVRGIEVTRRGRGGWAAEVAIRYGPKDAVRRVPGTVFRTAARLRSHNVRAIQAIRAGWVVRGRGWGHGVGMCQWGAIEMGRKGATETEILRYYFPGVAFTKVY
jgi:stage II sporulation protein D